MTYINAVNVVGFSGMPKSQRLEKPIDPNLSRSQNASDFGSSSMALTNYGKVMVNPGPRFGSAPVNQGGRAAYRRAKKEVEKIRAEQSPLAEGSSDKSLQSLKYLLLYTKFFKSVSDIVKKQGDSSRLKGARLKQFLGEQAEDNDVRVKFNTLLAIHCVFNPQVKLSQSGFFVNQDIHNALFTHHGMRTDLEALGDKLVQDLRKQGKSQGWPVPLTLEELKEAGMIVDKE